MTSDGRPVDPAARVMERYDREQTPEGMRRDLLDRVPNGARVLDVGCWSGFAGRYLAATRSAIIDGIEPEASVAPEPGVVYRQVMHAKAEQAIGALVAQGAKYDAILFLDVLEHMADPAETLRSVGDLMGPGARVLVSLPNVAHWWVRKEILRGRFNYRPNGVLDETHLRFFTFQTAERLLLEAGLTVLWRGASIDQPPLIRLGPRGLRLLERWPTVFAVQSLFEASRTSR